MQGNGGKRKNELSGGIIKKHGELTSKTKKHASSLISLVG